MKKSTNELRIIHSIGEYHDLLGYPPPAHPLITAIDLSNCREIPPLSNDKLILNLYNIFIKKNINGSMGYGQRNYDFSNGVMGFALPKQVFTIRRDLDISRLSGWMLLIHPDFIRKYPLAQRIDKFGFFSYEMNEALHLSDKEEAVIDRLMRDIRTEYEQPIDLYSQDVIVSLVEVLLNYSNRFYNRQFITRSSSSDDMLVAFEQIMKRIFEQEEMENIPTVQEIAAQLNLSPHYLGDMLRSLTGLNAQQQIHQHLIEKAKQLLLTTSISVNETAFKLGFGYPQYFNRLFKNKTGMTPAAYRKENREN